MGAANHCGNQSYVKISQIYVSFALLLHEKVHLHSWLLPYLTRVQTSLVYVATLNEPTVVVAHHSHCCGLAIHHHGSIVRHEVL